MSAFTVLIKIILTERIEAKSAEIIELPWIIKDGFKVTINNDDLKNDFKN